MYRPVSTLYIATMGWLRLVGSLKLDVSFAEYSLFDGALLQKRPIVLRSLLIIATPEIYIHMYVYIYTEKRIDMYRLYIYIYTTYIYTHVYIYTINIYT